MHLFETILPHGNLTPTFGFELLPNKKYIDQTLANDVFYVFCINLQIPAITL